MCGSIFIIKQTQKTKPYGNYTIPIAKANSEVNF